MGSDWSKVTLGDYCSKVGSGATPRGGSSVYMDFGVVCLIRSQNIYNDGFKSNGLVFIDETASAKLANVSVEANDVLLNITGDSVARVCLAKSEYLPARVNQHVAIIRPKPEEFDSRYLRYLLASPEMQAHLLNLASAGATRNALTKNMIESLVISKPSLLVQSAIADNLEGLDDKITLNRQINQTLEKMAQALFKSWFVDFDPVIDNALAAGNPIPEALQAKALIRQAMHDSNAASGKTQSLPDEIRNLFPSEFEESELGWIPKGWGVHDMTELLGTVSVTYPLKTVEKVVFLNTGDIESGRFLHQNYSPVAGLPGQAKKSIQNGDILFSEIRPQNKRFAYVNFDAQDYVVSTKLMVLRPKNNMEPLLPYFILTMGKNTRELQRIAELRSGTFPQITFKELEMINCVLPNTSNILEIFVQQYLKPYYERSFELTKQNANLTKLRDTLLPKLISGELRLDEVTQVVEEIEEVEACV